MPTTPTAVTTHALRSPPSLISVFNTLVFTRFCMPLSREFAHVYTETETAPAPEQDSVITNFGLVVAQFAAATAMAETGNDVAPDCGLADMLLALLVHIRNSADFNRRFEYHWIFAVRACLFPWVYRGAIDLCAPLPFFADAPADAPHRNTLFVTDRALMTHPMPFLAVLFLWGRPQNLGAPDTLQLPSYILDVLGANHDALFFVADALLSNTRWSDYLTYDALLALAARTPAVWRRVVDAQIKRCNAWRARALDNNVLAFRAQFAWLWWGHANTPACAHLLAFHLLRAYYEGIEKLKDTPDPMPRACTLQLQIRRGTLLQIHVRPAEQALGGTVSLHFDSQQDLARFFIAGAVGAPAPPHPAGAEDADDNGAMQRAWLRLKDRANTRMTHRWVSTYVVVRESEPREEGDDDDDNEEEDEEADEEDDDATVPLDKPFGRLSL